MIELKNFYKKWYFWVLGILLLPGIFNAKDIFSLMGLLFGKFIFVLFLTWIFMWIGSKNKEEKLK